MTSPAAPLPAVLAAVRLGWLQLVLRLAAGQGIERLALLFGLDMEVLARRLRAEPVRRLAAALQALVDVPAEACRERLVQRAEWLLRGALGAGRAGAARFVERARAQGLVPAELIARMAMRLLRRVELVSDDPRRRRAGRPVSRNVPAVVDPEAARANSLANRFALRCRREALQAEGQAHLLKLRDTGRAPSLPATEPPPPPVDYGPLPRNAHELAAYEGSWHPDHPPWEQPEWRWTIGTQWNPGDPPPARPTWDFDDFGPDPPEGAAPEPEPTEAERRLDLAFLNSALLYRYGQIPDDPARLERFRLGLVEQAGGRWPTPQRLGRAIRHDEWWPMGHGWKRYAPGHPIAVPPEIRAALEAQGAE